MVNVGIVGGTGYAGVELLRILSLHPEVNIRLITSRSNAGTAVTEMFPNLRGQLDLNFTEPSLQAYRACDLIFFATPNTVAMSQVEAMLEAGIKVIDLAADFRLKDVELWQKWYGTTHACPDVVAKAVYGLPEMNRDQIRSAEIVANPGCYPTTVTLALLPLLSEQLIKPDSIIADCKSGVSGAGRTANVATLFCEAAESVKAYGVSGHRHLPEIQQNLRCIDEQANLIFTPHLMPMIRGIHATVYADVAQSMVDVQKIFENYYRDEPFVDVMPAGSHPETRSVKGTNTCRIAVHALPESNKYVVLSVTDNLVKGAAGQAIQNMNIMFDLAEDSGLVSPGLMP